MKNITTPTHLAAAAVIAGCALLATSALADAQTPGVPSGVACSAQNRNAQPTYLETPEWPAVAQLMNLTGTTYVRVQIDPTGTPSQPEVARTSGVGVLDRAAVDAVMRSTFRPEVDDCVPVSGKYIIIVDFPSTQ